MTWFGFSSAIIAANYTATSSETVRADVTGGGWTLTTPGGVTAAANTAFAVKFVGGGNGNTLTLQAQGTGQFELPDGTFAPTMPLVDYGDQSYFLFAFDEGSATWRRLLDGWSPGETFLRYAPTVSADGPLSVGRIQKVSTAGGNVAFTAPANPKPDEEFGVKVTTHGGMAFVTADSIEEPWPGVGAGPDIFMYGVGATAIWKRNDTNTSWLIKSVGKMPVYAEAWLATPVAGMFNDVIQWTFQPLIAGQTPQIATHSAGTFTFPHPISVACKITGRWQYNIAANNDWVDWSLKKTTLISPDLMEDHEDSQAPSSRAGSFPRSFALGGRLDPTAGQTILWTGTSLGNGGSNVDLAEATLLFEV